MRFKNPACFQDKEEIKQQVETEFKTWIDQDLKVEEILEPSGNRLVKVYQDWTPCGGTHVKSLKEIEKMEISDISINKKEGILTVKYNL